MNQISQLKREVSADYQHKVGEMVNNEVYYCVSMLISELASNEQYMDDLYPLLSRPDYEGAAFGEGYRVKHHRGWWLYYEEGDIQSMRGAIETQAYESESEAWRECCDDNSIEPYYEEAYEHWIVSDWLARKLEEAGEMVTDDFLGLTLWGRCTTGQAILLDSVICSIYNDLHEISND